MNAWKEVQLSSVVDINARSYSSKDSFSGVYYLDTGNITQNTVDEIVYYDLAQEKLPSRAKRKIKPNSVVYSTVRPNQRHYGIIRKEMPSNFLVSTGFAVIDAKQDYLSPEYLYYFLTQNEIVETLQSIAEQSVSTYPSITAKDIGNLKLRLPPVETQKRIASILRALDDKIELNNRINENLEQQAIALFKAWFVDYSPYAGQLPSDWREYRLSEFLPVITGKKNANVSSSSGKYPFFSCSQDIAWTDEYSFEGNAILVAGNGDFNVKFYSGKFEAYQRTYVLIPYNPRFSAWLFYAVKYNLNKITIAARGSVIKFITKGNLEDFLFHAPSNLEDFALIDHFTAINNQIANNRNESSQLAKIRDTLLPKLMSGELDVSEIDL